MDIATTSRRPGLAVPRALVALPGLAALLGAAAVLQGGYRFERALPVAVGFAALAVIAGRRPRGRLVPAGFAALAATLLAGAGATGWPSAARTPGAALAIAVCAHAVAVRVARTDGATAVLEAVVGVAAVVALLGIAGVVLHLYPLAFAAGTWRIASTLTYQNAAGALFAIALAPAAALVARRDDALRRGAFVALAIGLAGTQSRGAIVAGALALGFAVILGVPARALARPAGAAIAGVAALVPAAAGLPAGPVLSAAGLAIAGWLAVSRSPAASRAAAAAALAAMLVLAVALPATALSGRLTLSSNQRARVWGSTLAAMGPDLLFGTGPGTYRLLSVRDGTPVTTEHAHNEYIQALSETGVVGLGGVLAAMGLFGAATWRARPRGARERILWAGVAAAGIAFCTTSFFDFTWRFPLLVAAAFTVLAAGLETHGGKT